MKALPQRKRLSLAQWDERYRDLLRSGLREPCYGGPLRRHIEREGDLRLEELQFDGSPAALRLWNFLLTENERLRRAREQGAKLVGAMKDLGTVPVLAYSFPELRAFYPDGAWWTPCLMQGSDRLLDQAEKLGFDASFCPVRAMLAAFEDGGHFPSPDLLVCSTGAVCDDFSAIAQRLERMGRPILWWEMPRRREPESWEKACVLPGGTRAPQTQVDCVREELERVAAALGELAGRRADEELLRAGIRQANRVRALLGALRAMVYGARAVPLPALEMLIAEMLAIHFCSDRGECAAVLEGLCDTAAERLRQRAEPGAPDPVRVFWVNPVADLRAMNLLEDCGGGLCGTDFMFMHALDPIPEDLPPLEALARSALADPMVGSAAERAARILKDCAAFGAEMVVVSRIPGASHCPWETALIREHISAHSDLPVAEVEIPPVCDAVLPSVRTRLEAAMEIARSRRVDS